MRRPRTGPAWVAVSVLACLTGCGHAVAPTPPETRGRPNFVVVIADDMAYGLFGPGKRFPFVNLPHLEALSSRAAFFDRAMVTTSLCSPSRATLLSGLYAHRHGVPGNESIDISPDIPTYPQILRASGYETAYVGKWHMDARRIWG
jgi:N-acetylglucosamine-6-sulfatase